MHSLYNALIAQHPRQLTPVRCAQSTIAQLHRYLEDVVLENNLSALVFESLPTSSERSVREVSRVRELSQLARSFFLSVSPEDTLASLILKRGKENTKAVIHRRVDQDKEYKRFVVISDARFSALLVSVHGDEDDDTPGDLVIWTFEPDVVYSALEYLMARLAAEHPYQAAAFGSAVRTSMPKATSLQLTLSVTTKLAHLLQEQAGREIAVNRIANAISESLALGVILQKTVDEVGTALKVLSCALRVEGQTAEQALTYIYFDDRSEPDGLHRESITETLDLHYHRLTDYPEVIVQDGSDESGSSAERLPTAVVPLILHERAIGALQVTVADPASVWNENEILLLRTVADQVAVAVNHAELFAKIQQQALTDALTGCYNRRSFEMQLDKDLQMARRLHQPLSLLMLDLDRFKQLNDSVGHDAGDDALRRLAVCFRQELRGDDSAARFGGA